MKKLFTLVILLQLTIIAQASTNIPAGNITTATWTAAGSPYLVQGNIIVNGTLYIQPGVEVVLQGFFHININGYLKAIGTQNQPITFRINDTTGWSNDIIPGGGWRGIYFNEHTGPIDSTLMQYCIVRDVKHGVNAPMNDNGAIFNYFRSMRLDHCEFFHNQSTANQSVGNIIVGSLKPGRTLEMAYCNIHDNATRVAAFKFDTYLGGYLYIHDNRFHHNTKGGTIFTIFSEMLFENNEVDSNSNSDIGMGTIRVDGGHNTLRGNKIHHNINQRLAAIACTMGKTTIEKNLICNNQMLDGNCGFTDGGGAIHISHNNNGVWDSTEYIIRDNIIANNYANYFGAGIYIHSCKAWVFNNHIVRNKSTMHGAGINVFGTTSQLYIQNNIFFGNESTNYGLKADVYVAGAAFYTFDYNWMEYAFYEVLNVSPGVQRNGDTINNVIAANPQLTNPTTISGYTDNAMAKDFHLLPASGCIEKGNLQNIMTAATDYYGMARISGTYIDIGAHEYTILQAEGINEVASFKVEMFPNPATDQLKIRFADQGLYQITGFDITGKQVIQQTRENIEAALDVSVISPGTYILSIQNKKGEKVTGKFIKK